LLQYQAHPPATATPATAGSVRSENRHFRLAGNALAPGHSDQRLTPPAPTAIIRALLLFPAHPLASPDVGGEKPWW